MTDQPINNVEQSRREDSRIVAEQPISDKPLRVGMACPRCLSAKIDYNGLLQWVCPLCNLVEAGAFT